MSAHTALALLFKHGDLAIRLMRTALRAFVFAPTLDHIRAQ
jgi:hypothetical protein